MKRGLLRIAMLAGGVLLHCGEALAQDEKVIDARLQGFPSKVALDNSSTAVTWLLFVALAALGLGVMFINSKRTHLD